MPPTWCPALPILCNAVAISPGDPICITMSTEPMSIPISSDDEVTTARKWPNFSFLSTSSLILLSIEPWCPATKSPKYGRSFWTSVSVIFLVFAKTKVVVCALIRSATISTFISRTFITERSLNLGEHNNMSKSNSRAPLIFAIFTSWLSFLLSLSSLATKYSATVSRGSMVAEIPILCTGRSRIVSSKEIVSAR